MGLFSFTDYEINKNNLLNNVKLIKETLNSGTKFCAVVKANAYGVGAGRISSILEPVVDVFAVANLSEGIELREAKITKKILTLSSLNFDYLNVYSKNFLTPPVSTVLEMSKLSSDLKNPLEVEFALNTGMNRIGFSKKSEILEALAFKNQNSKISIFGVFSHLSTKENDVDFMYEQKARFDDLCEAFCGEEIVKHLSNTNASLNHKDFNYDMVRVGFGLYGMSQNKLGLKPVVSIKSRIVLINQVDKGETVGYDRTYRTKSLRKIAVVPVGYFDGVNRRLSNAGKVIVNGKFAPIVGRVCMDSFMIDVTGIDNVFVGSNVIIIGEAGNLKISIEDHAKLVGTSEYEILSRFNNSRMNIFIM